MRRMVLISNDTFKTDNDMSDIFRKCLKKFAKYNITIITNENVHDIYKPQEPEGFAQHAAGLTQSGRSVGHEGFPEKAADETKKGGRRRRRSQS